MIIFIIKSLNIQFVIQQIKFYATVIIFIIKSLNIQFVIQQIKFYSTVTIFIIKSLNIQFVSQYIKNYSTALTLRTKHQKPLAANIGPYAECWKLRWELYIEPPA